MSICLHASRIKLPRGSRWNAHQLKSWKSVCWFFSSCANRVVVLFTYASIFRLPKSAAKLSHKSFSLHQTVCRQEKPEIRHINMNWLQWNQLRRCFFVPWHEIFAIEPHAAARIANSISCSAATLYSATRYFVIHSFLCDIRSVNWMHIRHLPHSKWALKCGTHRFVSNTKRKKTVAWTVLKWQ